MLTCLGTDLNKGSRLNLNTTSIACCNALSSQIFSQTHHFDYEMNGSLNLVSYANRREYCKPSQL